MPIYEYSCKKCKEDFTIFQSIHSKTEETSCPKCGSKDVQKKLSAFSCCSVGSGSSVVPSFGGTFGGA